ncbi:MAG TPA: isocitrate lyase/phosphoenolpyruvate mutase family protein [Thermoanaerobaculia bacterium]|nr:isocitrate lyase/phosphoenolpyruvate mutase family protein [Thermoanaerobaculia bacterium]
MATPQHERARRFREMHARERAFVLPNPWDAGSARMLEALGFEALATTSSGFANSLARLDGEVTLDETLAHCRALCAATDVPITADLENGFGADPERAAATVVAAAAAGVVGGSIEDYSGDPAAPIYDLAHAVERIHAAAEAAHGLDLPFTLTARAESFLQGRRDLDDTIRRLQAFEEAGADVLYAPGLTTLEEVREVCQAVSRPVNVLAPMIRGATLDELEAAGARRLSVGGALARAALGGMLRAAEELREGGFGWVAEIAPGAEVAKLLARPGT